MNDEFFISEVAKLYYIDKIKQNEIAERFSVSPMVISRAIKEAEQNNIVTFHVKTPWKLDSALGNSIRKALALKECIVLDIMPNREMKAEIGAYLADYFMGMLSNAKIVGISWGRTIAKFAEALPYSRIERMELVQLTGCFWEEKGYSVTPTGIMLHMAEKLGAKSYFLNAPLYVPTEEMCQIIKGDQMNQVIFEKSQKCDVTICGASKLDRNSTTFRMGVITDEDYNELEQKGAIGDIAGTFIDAAGNEIIWSKTKLYTGTPQSTISKANNCICVAGEAKKAQVILAGARKKMFNMLIISRELATEMVSYSQL